MRDKKLDMTLYLVTDSSYHTEETFLSAVEEACKGGITLLQLREKISAEGNIWIRQER